MALKAGTDNKRNVIIAGVLFCVLAYLAISQLMGGPATPPARVAAPPRVTVPRTVPQRSGESQAIGGATTNVSSGGRESSSPAAHRLVGSGLDPALHLDKLALSESIEYAGSGRNIFSADSAPVHVDEPIAPARPTDAEVAAATAPVIPQPPAIDLHYFGYAADKAGKRQAFLLHGDDIFEASAGDIVNHRYKVVAVDLHSVQVTDLSYNNTQTLPLSAN